MTEDSKKAKLSIWAHRGRRFASGLNILVMIIMAFAAVCMVNYISNKYYHRWDLSASDYFKLSAKTRNYMSGLKADVEVIAFFQKNNEIYQDVYRLLKEYEFENAKLPKPRLKIQILDADRDLVKVRELAQKYDIKEPNVVVFESGGRKKYIEARELSGVEYQVKAENKVSKRRVAFKGEQLFTSAIQCVAQEKKPVVYFLKGHGEHQTDDFNEQSGYSKIGIKLKRENIEVKSIILAEQQGMPPDCSMLVIAGPRKNISKAEVEMLQAYLNRNGRLLLLLDPAVNVGLDEMLKGWGVKLAEDKVYGATYTKSDLIIAEYGDHPITRNFKDIATMFFLPRSVEPISNEKETPADKPKTTVLAFTTEGWAETNLGESPARFHSGVDRPGPVSVAVAIEKGPVSGIEVEIKPTRMVVIGDSMFVANPAYDNAPSANIDFFISCVNWLVERETMLGISPKVPDELQIGMTDAQFRRAFAAIALWIPALIALIGLVVWIRRR